jgi:hypothetical protein
MVSNPENFEENRLGDCLSLGRSPASCSGHEALEDWLSSVSASQKKPVAANKRANGSNAESVEQSLASSGVP